MNSAAFERGRKAATLTLAPSLNPYPEHTWDHTEWQHGWIQETGARLRRLAERAPASGPALIIPHPSMTAEQCELVCRREGLALAHLGRARLVLVHTSGRPQTMLRIAPPLDPEAA
jgi:hypothetical protein